jgi:Sec-independent protein translocase protein TatA
VNFFGIGGAELVLVILIMIVVAGPKRMATWAFLLGRYMGKLRQMWAQVADVIQQEVDAAGMDVKVPREMPTRQNLAKMTSQVLKPYMEPLEQAGRELERDLKKTGKELEQDLKKTGEELEQDIKQVEKATKRARTAAGVKSTLPKLQPATNGAANGADAPAKDVPPPSTDSNTPGTRGNQSAADDKANGDLGSWSNPEG